MTASVTLSVHLVTGECGHRILRKGKRPKHAKPVRLPRITRLMALSIKYEHLLRKGLVDSHGELAGLAGADRSVISRIIRLRLLAPDIQEWLISLPEQNPGGDPVGWTQIRPLTRIVSWEEQRRKLNRLLASKGLSLPQVNGLACGDGTTKGRKNKEK
jgi:hypothetical protein